MKKKNKLELFFFFRRAITENSLCILVFSVKNESKWLICFTFSLIVSSFHFYSGFNRLKGRHDVSNSLVLVSPKLLEESFYVHFVDTRTKQKKHIQQKQIRQKKNIIVQSLFSFTNI